MASECFSQLNTVYGARNGADLTKLWTNDLESVRAYGVMETSRTVKPVMCISAVAKPQ